MTLTLDASEYPSLETAQQHIEHSHLGPATYVDPRKVSALILRVLALIRKLLPIQVSEERLRAPDGILGKVVVDSFVEAGGDFRDAIPFALLEAKRIFESQATGHNLEINSDRALAAEILARRCAWELLSPNPTSPLHNVTWLCLSKRFSYVNAEGHITPPTSALEVAVDQNSVLFLSSPEAQACVQAIWSGRLLQSFGMSDGRRTVFFVPSEHPDGGESFLDHFNLKSPRTVYALSLLVFIALLVVFSMATTEYKGLNAWEILLWVMLAGYALEDMVRWLKLRGLGSLNIWAIVDVLQHTLAITAFSLRVSSYLVHSVEDKAKYQLLAFQFLSTLAPLLWFQSLKAFDLLPFFGGVLEALIRMLRETGIFLVLLVVVGLGFAQALFSLDAADGHRVDNVVMIVVDTLLSGLLAGGVSFDAVEDNFGELFGKTLLYIYSFVQVLLLSNILVALLNQAYQDVVDSDSDTFAAYFATKVMMIIRAPDEYAYPAPFNLVEIFLIAPWEYVVSASTYRRINHIAQRTLFFLPLFFIALWESRNRSTMVQRIRLEMLEDEAPAPLAVTMGTRGGEFTIEDPDEPTAANASSSSNAAATEIEHTTEHLIDSVVGAQSEDRALLLGHETDSATAVGAPGTADATTADGRKGEEEMIITRVKFSTLVDRFPAVDDEDEEEKERGGGGGGGDEGGGGKGLSDSGGHHLSLLRDLMEEVRSLRREVRELKQQQGGSHPQTPSSHAKGEAHSGGGGGSSGSMGNGVKVETK